MFYILYKSFHSGALYESTGNHDAGFYMAGTVFLISGLMLMSLAWVKHNHSREDERRPLKENTSASTSGYASESEFGPQSALAWPFSLPPFEEFFPRINEDAERLESTWSLPFTPSPNSILPTTRLTATPRW